MPARVGVLHHPRSFFPPELYQAVDGAVELVWVLVDHDPADRVTRQLLPRLGAVADISSSEPDAAAASLAALGLDGIVTFVDDHLVLAAELAARLGLLFHTPEVASTIVNKCRQRAALGAAQVPGPQFWTLPAGLRHDDLIELCAEIRYPAVLKPAYGSGSRGIVGLAGVDDLVDAYVPELEALVEEHLEDDPGHDRRFASYLSVESVVSGGEASHVAITGRFPLASGYRETGNFIPAALPESSQSELLEVTNQAIGALGITDSVLHTEIKLTPDGPRLIEVNGRLGGRPPFVLQSISDVNLFQVACRLAAGERVHLPRLVKCREVGYWRMLQPPTGASRVLDVRGVTEIRELEHVDSAVVNRGAGQAVDARLGTDGSIVTIRGRVGSLEALAEMIDLIDRSVSIEYEL